MNKLLAERDKKQAELATLRAKSETDLWTEDLDAFLEALDKQEEKERRDQGAAVKAMKKKAQDEPKKGGKKGALLKHEVMPSPHGLRVLPRIDQEMRAKYEKIEKASIIN